MNLLEYSSKKRDIQTVFRPQLLLCYSRLNRGMLFCPKKLQFVEYTLQITVSTLKEGFHSSMAPFNWTSDCDTKVKALVDITRHQIFLPE